MRRPGVKKGVTFRMSNEMIERAPAEWVRKAAAEHAGHLLVDMLLDPDADPFTDLQLHAERLTEESFRQDGQIWRVMLTCAEAPPVYTPLRTMYGPAPRGLE